MRPQTLSRSNGAVRWLDENGMPRSTNAAWHDAAQIVLSHAVPIIAKMQTEPVAVAEQTPAAVAKPAPAPKVELREFTFRYWTKSDGQGHQDILAENREQALAVLWMLDGDYISKVWAD